MHRFFWLCFFSCALTGGAGAATLSEFESDGCSLFPDGTLQDRTLWCDCCFEHDVAYWRGGTEEERRQADEKLRECILARTKNRALSEIMYEGVRAGGSPVFPTWYRWGYGWTYGRGYQSLTAEEQRQATEMLVSYRKANPAGYCRKP